MSEKSANRDANVIDTVLYLNERQSKAATSSLPGRTKHSLKHRFRCYMQQRSLEVDNFLMQDLDSFRRLKSATGSDQPVTNFITTVKGPSF